MEIHFLADNPEYVNELAELYYNQWKSLVPDRSLDDFIIKTKTHLNNNSLPLTLLSLDNNRLLGCASLRKEDLNSRKDLSPWLAGVLVRESERGKGICKSLEQAVCAKAKQMGHSRLYLFTFDKEALYFHLGWESIGIEMFGEQEVILMQKYL
jgi:N-acetylglutamate synthase-like GNAT family acetyltransferase